MRDDGGDVYNMINFNAALLKLRQGMNFIDHIRGAHTGEGVSLRFLYTKLKFTEKWTADKNHVEGLHLTRIADLNDQLDGLGDYYGRAFKIQGQLYDYVLREYRDVDLDLKAETEASINAIDLLQYNTRNQPLALNYVNLTYNDAWGQFVIAANFADISVNEWTTLKTDCKAVIRRVYVDSVLEQNRWINGFNNEDNNLVGLEPCFGRLESDRGKKEHWKEKIHALYQTAQLQVDV